jgi:polyphosphate glucokinase
MHVFGLDIGGSGMKGAVVDLETGSLITPRYRIPTPDPATPDAMAATAAAIVQHFQWSGPIGCGFPAVVKRGVVYTAANVSPLWIGTNGEALLTAATAQPVYMLNDADAAGIAEMRLGAGRDKGGLVLMLTIGTGLGTALFLDGKLVPNTELGHIEIRGKDAERRASNAARERKNLSWSRWAARLDEYLQRIVGLIWPDLIIIGGGLSRDYYRFASELTVKVDIVPAQLRNEAGIIGAALAAAENLVAIERS